MAFEAFDIDKLNEEYNRLKKPIFREGSSKLERQDTTATNRASPLMRQMTDLTLYDKDDGEVEDIMTRRSRPSTPRLQEIHRGSSTIPTPEQMIEDSRRTAKRQKAQSTGIRHDAAYQVAKRGNPDIAKRFLHGTKTERRHSIGGKTRKRRKRRKPKRRKSKRGGGFFSRRKSPKKRKEEILMGLLDGDKDKVSRCLELNNTGKACQLDKQNTPGIITPSCASYNGMVRGPAGRMCGPVLQQAAKIYQKGSAKKRRTKRRKRKRRNSTRRKKRS